MQLKHEKSYKSNLFLYIRDSPLGRSHLAQPRGGTGLLERWWQNGYIIGAGRGNGGL
jgi:hypothetical protein